MSVQSGRAYRTEVSYPIICTYTLLQSQGVSKHFESTFLPQNWWRHLFSTNLKHNPQIEYFFSGKIGTAGIDSWTDWCINCCFCVFHIILEFVFSVFP